MRQSFCGTTDPKRVPDIYVTGLGHCRPKVTDDPCDDLERYHGVIEPASGCPVLVRGGG